MTNINVNEITTIEEVREAVLNRAFDVVEYVARPKVIKEGTVIDENQTVKWNREEVERINKANSEAYLAYRKELSNAYDRERETVINVFAKEYGVSTAKVERVFSHAWSESHSSGMYEVLQTLEELMDLIIDVNNID